MLKFDNSEAVTFLILSMYVLPVIIIPGLTLKFMRVRNGVW